MEYSAYIPIVANAEISQQFLEDLDNSSTMRGTDVSAPICGIPTVA